MIDFSNLRHFRSPLRVILFAEVLLKLVLLKVLVETVRLPRLLQLVEPGRPSLTWKGDLEVLKAFTDIILGRILKTRRPCMLRSLLLYRYMKSRGMAVQVVFGVRQGGGRLEGHAWLLRDGRPFPGGAGENEAGEYKVVHFHPGCSPSGASCHEGQET